MGGFGAAPSSLHQYLITEHTKPWQGRGKLLLEPSALWPEASEVPPAPTQGPTFQVGKPRHGAGAEWETGPAWSWCRDNSRGHCVLAWSHSWLLSRPGPTLPSENRLLLLLHPVPAETKNTQAEGKKKTLWGWGKGRGRFLLCKSPCTYRLGRSHSQSTNLWQLQDGPWLCLQLAAQFRSLGFLMGAMRIINPP